MRRRKKRMNPVGAVLIVLVVFGGLTAAAVLIRALFAFASGENVLELSEAAEEEAVPQPKQKSEPESIPEPSAPQFLMEDLTPKFPVKVANRAALTAMTNYYASDVRNSDGTYNPTWFHAYSDTSGETEKYLIYDWQTGIWTGKDQDTWHVDFMELNGADGGSRVVSMDVSFNGSEYLITNAEDLTDDSGGELDTALPPFRVSQYLIAEDRVFE